MRIFFTTHFSGIRLFSTLFLLSVSFGLFAQGSLNRQVDGLKLRGVSFHQVDLFNNQKAIDASDLLEMGIDRAVLSTAYSMDVNDAEKLGLLTKKPSQISLSLTSPSGSIWVVDLFEYDFRDSELTMAGNTGAITWSEDILLYRGSVSSIEGSMAAFTITSAEVRGMLIVNGSTYTLGKSQNGAHILYHLEDFTPGTEFSCNALETDESLDDSDHKFEAAPKSLRCVKVKAEVEQNLILYLGGVENAITYAIGLFNEVTTLYANDDITLVLSELYLWENGSPYSGSAFDYLQQMSNNSPNANLTAMLSRSNFGGVAYLNSACSFNYGVSYNGVYGSYNSVPSYSWDAMVVSHEIGHNLSSPHTHDCAWNGNNTAIDGCGPQAGYSDGCTAPLPSNGGTIMSYCHLIGGVGINFNNGFGVQPANKIRNYVNNASCLATTCIGIGEEPEPEYCTPINFNDFAITIYAPGLSSGTSVVQENGATLQLQNNTGRSIDLDYTLTPFTILEFQFRSTSQAQVHGIGFNNSSNLNSERIFKIYGTLNNNQTINNFSTYSGSSYITYTIPVGSFYTGSNLDKLFFVSGNVNGNPSGNSYFRNVRVYESGTCSIGAISAQNTAADTETDETTLSCTLYPNPASTQVQLFIDGDEWPLMIRIFDLSGKLLHTQQVTASTTVVSTSELTTGMYIIEGKSISGSTFREKLFIVR